MRVYTMNFAGVAITAVQDLLMLLCTSASAIEIHEIVIGQISATTVGNLNISLKRMPATVTVGSGGNAGTINKNRSGDAATTISGRINDTVQATTSGTAVTIHSDVYNPINGWQFLPAPEDRPACNVSEAFVVSLNTAPASSETMSGMIRFAELVPA